MATKGALNGHGDSSHIEQVAVDLDTVAEKIDMEAKGYAELEIQKETHEVLDDPDARKYERRYLRKLDMIILPTVSGLYFFEYLDRGNVANAKLLGLDEGHDTAGGGVGPGRTTLSANQWEVVIMIFYVGIILLQIPGCIGYRIFSPSKWIAFGVCFWCVVCMLQDVTTNYAGLLACRIFLGAFEGLFGTGIVYYLSLWYRRDEMCLRVFWFLGPTAVAGAFGGLISFGIGHVKGSTPQWKWLFLVEGLPGFLLGAFCLYWLPDRPMKNSRFRGKDQEIAVARYRSEAIDRTGPIQRKHVIWALSDWRLYLQALVYMPTACLLSSISGFLPTIVSDLGYKSSTSANLMTVPPYACAFALMFMASYSSDRFRERGIHITCFATGSAICYVIIANLSDDSLKAKYALVCLATSCVYASFPAGHAWAANNFGNETKRAIGMGLYTALGNFGSIGGSFFYPTTDGPIYRKGHYLSFGMSLAAAIVALSNHFILRAVNKHRDKRYGKPVEGLAIDVTEDADNLPMFRFIT